MLQFAVTNNIQKFMNIHKTSFYSNDELGYLERILAIQNEY